MAAAEAVATRAAIVTIPIAALVPREDQPRQYFDEQGLQELLLRHRLEKWDTMLKLFAFKILLVVHTQLLHKEV